jgi:hypothetical protein
VRCWYLSLPGLGACDGEEMEDSARTFAHAPHPSALVASLVGLRAVTLILDALRWRDARCLCCWIRATMRGVTGTRSRGTAVAAQTSLHGDSAKEADLQRARMAGNHDPYPYPRVYPRPVSILRRLVEENQFFLRSRSAGEAGA